MGEEEIINPPRCQQKIVSVAQACGQDRRRERYASVFKSAPFDGLKG
jgi:hypothetical protein